MAEEAAMLQPDYLPLWIGNNEVLGYVLGGGRAGFRTSSS